LFKQGQIIFEQGYAIVNKIPITLMAPGFQPGCFFATSWTFRNKNHSKRAQKHNFIFIFM